MRSIVICGEVKGEDTLKQLAGRVGIGAKDIVTDRATVHPFRSDPAVEGYVIITPPCTRGIRQVVIQATNAGADFALREFVTSRDADKFFVRKATVQTHEDMTLAQMLEEHSSAMQ